MSAQQIRPSRVWYWVAGAMAVGSVVWFVLNLVLGLGVVNRQVDGFQRVSLPGQGEVRFTEPGGYVLYYEGLGASDATIPAFNASLVAVGGDGEVPISDYGGSLTYDFSGNSGQAVGTFHIDKPGRFLLRTESGVDGTQANVAVGRSVSGGIFRTVVLVLVGTLVLFFGGAALAVIVAIRRHRSGRLLPATSVEGGGGTRGAGSEGWFADPSKRHELRYWDGETWTEHVVDRGTQAVDPMSHPR